MKKDIKRTIKSAEMLVQFGIEHGMSLEECIAGCNLSENGLFGYEKEIRGDQELGIISNLVRALGVGLNQGWNLGLRYCLGTHGTWGFAVISSQTLGYAIKLGIQYLDLTYSFIQVNLEVKNNEARLVFNDNLIPPAVREFSVARTMAASTIMLDECLGSTLSLRRIALKYPRPKKGVFFASNCDCKTEFSTRKNYFAFDKHFLDMPLPQQSGEANRILEVQCRELLNTRTVNRNVVEQVRSYLKSQSNSFPDMTSTADKLGMTPRTLHRHLKKQGFNWRSLISEARKSRSETLLTGEYLSLEDIAESLGYSEVSNFI